MIMEGIKHFIFEQAVFLTQLSYYLVCLFRSAFRQKLQKLIFSNDAAANITVQSAEKLKSEGKIELVNLERYDDFSVAIN